jgi:hypothetical protein
MKTARLKMPRNVREIVCKGIGEFAKPKKSFTKNGMSFKPLDILIEIGRLRLRFSNRPGSAQSGWLRKRQSPVVKTPRFCCFAERRRPLGVSLLEWLSGL